MKTLITLLTFTILFNLQILPQRNPGTDRKSPGDRIDRVDDGNPVRNPLPHREPIQDPQRTKEEQPTVTYNPEPEIYQPICHPHPPVEYDYQTPLRPPHYSQTTIIIDTEPKLEDLTYDEVLELGTIHLDSEEYSDAIKCFNHLLKNDPLDFEVLTLRGRSYHGLEFFDKAKKDFQKSIKINKSYGDAYYYLGLTEIELGDIDAAKVDFELAAELGNEKAKQIMNKYFNQ